MSIQPVKLKSSHMKNEEPETRGSVLVVEDNPRNLKLVRTLLEINHFFVLEAADAESGIKIAKSCRPDLILMDIHLPGMDGLRATKIIKDTPELESIKVIALTSYAMEGDSKKAIAAGCDAYITKPINTRKFIQQISPYLTHPERVSEPNIDSRNDGAPQILIVDDEPMNLKLLRAKLSKNYSRITEATDGREALQKASAIQPDLILLDIMMPGLDGFEVTRQLKSSPDTRFIPIILITALDGHNYKVMGYEAGADEFLNKPINTFELLTRVKSLLRMKKGQDRLLTGNSSSINWAALDSLDGYASFPSKKVLIVLKDPEQREMIQMYLFGQIYEILFSEDPDEAAEYIHENLPDVILFDSQIEGNRCLELCCSLKKDQSTRNCQVLYLMSEKELESDFRHLENCVDDFLTRPVNIYELRARIKVLLKKKAFFDNLFDGQTNDFQRMITDPLTGLYNFEYCKHVLKHELQRSLREKSTVSLVVMEVNEPSASQSLVGHSAGDTILMDLGKLLKQSIRKLDIASRKSKRTFAFVLPETDDAKTHGFIRRVTGIIDSKLWEANAHGHLADKRLVFGHAVCPDDSSQLDELIQLAMDRLMANRAAQESPQ